MSFTGPSTKCIHALPYMVHQKSRYTTVETGLLALTRLYAYIFILSACSTADLNWSTFPIIQSDIIHWFSWFRLSIAPFTWHLIRVKSRLNLGQIFLSRHSKWPLIAFAKHWLLQAYSRNTQDMHVQHLRISPLCLLTAHAPPEVGWLIRIRTRIRPFTRIRLSLIRIPTRIKGLV